MKGIIEKIIVYPEKGSAGKELAEARFIENLGLEGDFHATGGERQLSLLVSGEQEYLNLTGQKEKGLCFSRFKANIVIRGLSADSFTPGARLTVADAILEITGETKRCHEECALYQVGKTCSLAGRSLFAKVLKSGIIRANDSVNVK